MANGFEASSPTVGEAMPKVVYLRVSDVTAVPDADELEAMVATMGDRRR